MVFMENFNYSFAPPWNSPILLYSDLINSKCGKNSLITRTQSLIEFAPSLFIVMAASLYFWHVIIQISDSQSMSYDPFVGCKKFKVVGPTHKNIILNYTFVLVIIKKHVLHVLYVYPFIKFFLREERRITINELLLKFGRHTKNFGNHWS